MLNTQRRDVDVTGHRKQLNVYCNIKICGATPISYADIPTILSTENYGASQIFVYDVQQSSWAVILLTPDNVTGNNAIKQMFSRMISK